MYGVLIYLGIMVLIGLLLIIKRKNIKIEPLIYIPLKEGWERFGLEVELKRDGKKIKKHVIPLVFLVLYKTKIGIRFIDRVLALKRFSGAIRRVLRIIGYLSIGLCFLFALLALYAFISHLWVKFTATAVSVPGVVLVLPFKIKGQMYVPWFYWLICVFIIAVVHEFGHAIQARLNGIPIDSTGPAFLSVLIPLVPAAFVEPNEFVLEHADKKKRLNVYAAGPVFNVVLGLLCVAMFVLVLNRFAPKLQERIGLEITDIENQGLKKAGMMPGEVMTRILVGDTTGIDKKRIYRTIRYADLSAALDNLNPGDNIKVCTMEDVCYPVVLQAHPRNPDLAYLGIFSLEKTNIKQSIIKKYGFILPKLFIWFTGLFLWLAVLNIGVGLFNALPMGPLDGGQLLFVSLNNKRYKREILAGISVLFFVLIVLSFM